MFRYCEGIIDLDAEIADRAFNLVPRRSWTALSRLSIFARFRHCRLTCRGQAHQLRRNRPRIAINSVTPNAGTAAATIMS
jgi:hypothetical protein